ncbi:MAG: PaaI family thioesterase [Pseudomonadota bacterium]
MAGDFEAQNPDYAAVVAASFAKQRFLALIGTELESVTPGQATLSVPFNTKISQQQGFFHGAALGALGDTASGYASLSLMPVGSEVVTVEYKVNFLKPAVGERLVVVGTVLRAGRSITVAQSDIFVRAADGAQTLVGALQGTFMRVELPG